jgi:tetrahydromethanopterin S-methyltransferase subunit C
MRMPLVSRILFCLVSVYLVVGAHIADYSRTHLFDPRWPPHAKFHDGQTLMFSSLLAALTIRFALRRTEDKMNSLIATTSFAALYWVTQALAIVYPGTAFVDPEFNTARAYLLGLPAQVTIDIIALSLISVALYLAACESSIWTR